MIFRVAVALVAISTLTLPSFAQGTTSRLLGVVTDSSGAAIVNANVTLTNEGTAAAFATVTGANGAYTFDALQSGLYSLTVEASGFRKFAAKGNRVTIGQPTTVNLTLQLGAVTEVVEVSGAAEVVQTATSGNHGQLLEEKTIKDLPIVGTRGRNLETFTGMNNVTRLLPPGTNPQQHVQFPNLARGSILVRTVGVSDYDSLQMKFQRRYHGGLGYLLAYTLSDSTQMSGRTT